MNLTFHLLLLVVVGISCVPHGVRKESPHFSQVATNAEVSSLTVPEPRSKKWHLEPVSVTKISKKDQDTREPYTVSEAKESHSVFSNLNGNRHGFKQEHQQVLKNGKLVSKLVHQQTRNAEKGGKPHVEDRTEVDIPELNIHEKIMNNDGFVRKNKEKRSSNQPVLPDHSAAELAGYVLETGDQASVVQFLGKMIEDGKISEEEALVYVETIKSYIKEAEKVSGGSDDEEENIREILLERKLEEYAREQKVQEEEEAKEEFMRSLFDDDQTENDSILKINHFLEASLNEGKISKSLFNHLKKVLIESVVAGMGQNINSMDSVDYAQY